MSGGGVAARRGPGAASGQPGVTIKDALVQAGQRRTRFRALLLDKTAASFPVEAQCVGRPADRVEGGHLVSDESFVQGVSGQQLSELTHQGGVLPKFQLALDPLEDGGPALLFESVPYPRHPVAVNPAQRLATPEVIGLAQQPGRIVVVTGDGEGGRFLAQPAEPVHVDRLGVDVEHVATPRSPYQVNVVAHGLAQ